MEEELGKKNLLRNVSVLTVLMGRVQIIDLEHRNLKHFLGWMTPLCGSEWSVCSDIPYFSGTEEVEGGPGREGRGGWWMFPIKVVDVSNKLVC